MVVRAVSADEQKNGDSEPGDITVPKDNGSWFDQVTHATCDA